MYDSNLSLFKLKSRYASKLLTSVVDWIDEIYNLGSVKFNISGSSVNVGDLSDKCSLCFLIIKRGILDALKLTDEKTINQWYNFWGRYVKLSTS